MSRGSSEDLSGSSMSDTACLEEGTVPQMIDFTDPQSCAFHDCQIKLDNGTVMFASKAVLGLSSRVLGDAITSCAVNDVLSLPMKSEHDVCVFLNLIYPSSDVDLHEDMLPAQLAISHELDVPALKERCEQFIVARVGIEEGTSIRLEEALSWCWQYECDDKVKARCEELLLAAESPLMDVETAALAERYELDCVLHKCIERLARDFDDVRHDSRLCTLQASTVQQIAAKGYERLKLRLKAVQSRLYPCVSRRSPTSSGFHAMHLAEDTAVTGPEAASMSALDATLARVGIGAGDHSRRQYVRRTGSSYV